MSASEHFRTAPIHRSAEAIASARILGYALKVKEETKREYRATKRTFYKVMERTMVHI